MGFRKTVFNYGYTLMELILAIAIVGTVSAVAIPNYARYIESTREKVCSINRQEILYEYQLYCLSEQEIPLSDYLHLTYEGKDPNFCPSGGLPAADGSGETAELTCSLHHETITLQGMGSAAEADTIATGDLLNSLLEN